MSDHNPMAYSDDVKKQRIIDAQTLRVNGPSAPTHSIEGGMQKKRMQADLPKASNINPYMPPYSAPPSVRNTSHLPDLRDITASTPSTLAGQRVRYPAPQPVSPPSAPIFPFVDTAFSKIPTAWYWVLLAVGALFGFAHAASTGAAGGVAIGQAIIGAFAGLVVIPVLKLGIKIVLAALALGVVGLILYFVYQAMK